MIVIINTNLVPLYISIFLSLNNKITVNEQIDLSTMLHNNIIIVNVYN